MAVAFTDRELDIMAVLWEHGPSTVAEVRAELEDVVSHNTIATILTILEQKGHVAHTTEGRAFRYHPRVGREEAGQSVFTRLVDTMFAGSAEALISHFVKDRRLGKEELERIREILDDRIARHEPNATTRRRKP